MRMDREGLGRCGLAEPRTTSFALSNQSVVPCSSFRLAAPCAPRRARRPREWPRFWPSAKRHSTVARSLPAKARIADPRHAPRWRLVVGGSQLGGREQSGNRSRHRLVRSIQQEGGQAKPQYGASSSPPHGDFNRGRASGTPGAKRHGLSRVL